MLILDLAAAEQTTSEPLRIQWVTSPRRILRALSGSSTLLSARQCERRDPVIAIASTALALR